MNQYLTNHDWFPNEIPEWFDPEDEGSCIAATVYGLQQALKDIPEDAVFKCERRYSLTVNNKA